MVKVSIITPFYNTEEFLERCINSVLNQTFTNLQFILIDDGSQDNSLKIAENFASKDNRILLLKQENKGQSIARNSAFPHAKGEFIAFLDSDDYWATNKLSAQLDFITKNNVDGCFVNYKSIKINKIEEIKPLMKHGHIVSLEEIATNNCIVGSCSSLIIKKSFFNEITLFEPNRYMEDYDLWFKIINNGAQLIFLDKYLVYIDDTGGSSMSNSHKMFFDHYYVFRKHLPIIFKKINDNSQLVKILNNRLNHSLIYAKGARYKLYFYIAKSYLLLLVYFKRGVFLWKP